MAIGPTYGTGPSDVFHWSRANANYMEVLWSAGAWLATPADLVRIIDSLDPSDPASIRWPRPRAVDVPAVRVHDEPDRWYGLGLICWLGGEWGHTGTLESAHAIVVHRTDGMTYSILVSGNYPRETDDLVAIYNDVSRRPA